MNEQFSGIFHNGYHDHSEPTIYFLSNENKKLILLGNKNQGRSIITVIDYNTCQVIKNELDDEKSDYYIIGF